MREWLFVVQCPQCLTYLPQEYDGTGCPDYDLIPAHTCLIGGRVSEVESSRPGQRPTYGIVLVETEGEGRGTTAAYISDEDLQPFDGEPF
jgi:hypothetical protein